MGKSEPHVEVTGATLKEVLKSQYHAALAMLRQTIEQCPEEAWVSQDHCNAFWQISYHTLFFTHLYLQPNEQAFQPWPGQQSNVQHPDGIAGRADPDSSLPLVPEPYTREQVLAYWRHCDEMVDAAVGAIDLTSPDSGFSWYDESKLEHQLINLRHVQHHTAQLADRNRAAAGSSTSWVSSRTRS